MMVQQVTSLDLRELQPYRTMRRPADHIKEKIFVAEGGKVVERLIRSKLSIVSALMTDEWYGRLQPALEERIPAIYIAEKALLEKIVGYNLHQGIMAVGKVPADPSLGEIIGKSANFLIVALDGLMNAENVGLVVRNCAAFGVDAILSGRNSSSPYMRR